MELIQCSELSSRLADLNKIQEHITPEGCWWPRAREGSPGPTLVDLLVPHQRVGHDTPNQQGGDHLPALGCPPSPCGSPCIPRALKTQLVHPPKGLAAMGSFPVGRGGDAGLSVNWRRGKLMVDLSMAKTNVLQWFALISLVFGWMIKPSVTPTCMVPPCSPRVD